MPPNGDGRRTVTVGTTTTVISRQQHASMRVMFTLANVSTSNQDVFIAFGQDAALNSGVYLAAGGSYSESRDPAFNPTNDDIHAIASAVGAVIAITERMDYTGIR